MKRLFVSLWLSCLMAHGAALAPGLGLSFRNVPDMTNYNVLAIQTNLISIVAGEGVFNYTPGAGVVDHLTVFPATGIVGTWRRTPWSLGTGGTGTTNLFAATCVNTVADMVAFNPVNGTNVYAMGRVTRNDGAGGLFYWTPTGTTNLGTCFAGVTGYWNRVIDGPTETVWFGTPVVPTDATAYLADAITVAKASQLKQLLINPGHYTNTAQMDITGIHVSAYDVTLDSTYGGLDTPQFIALGTQAAYLALDANANEYETNVVSLAGVGSLAQGDIVIINDTADFTVALQGKKGEMNKVFYVDAVNNIISLEWPLRNTYLVASTARISKVTPATGSIRGITLNCFNAWSAAVSARSGIWVELGDDYVIEDCTVTTPYIGYAVTSSYKTIIHNCRAYDGWYVATNSYGASIGGASEGTLVDGCEFLNFWAATDSVGTSRGVSWNTTIRDTKGYLNSNPNAVFAQHQGCGSVIYEGCRAVSDSFSAGCGFDLVAREVLVKNCTVRNAYRGVAQPSLGSTSLSTRMAVVENCTFEHIGATPDTYSGGVFMTDTKIGTMKNLVFRNNTVRDSSQFLCDQGTAYAFVISNLVVDGLVLNNSRLGYFVQAAGGLVLPRVVTFSGVRATFTDASVKPMLRSTRTNDMVLENSTIRGYAYVLTPADATGVNTWTMRNTTCMEVTASPVYCTVKPNRVSLINCDFYNCSGSYIFDQSCGDVVIDNVNVINGPGTFFNGTYDTSFIRNLNVTTIGGTHSGQGLLSRTNLNIGNVTVRTNLQLTKIVSAAALGTDSSGNVKASSGVRFTDGTLTPSDPEAAASTNLSVQGGIYSYQGVVTNNLVVGTGTSPGTTMVDIGPAAQGTNAMRVSGGIQTASVPSLIVTQNWNAAGTTFIGAVDKMTTTASAAHSLIHDFQSGGAGAEVSVLAVRKDGALLKQDQQPFMLVSPGESTAGNARGAFAVDLQMGRNAATKVASGASSFCVGTNNTASGVNSSVVGGAGTISSGQYAIAQGNASTSSGIASVAFGDTCAASGNYSVALGVNSTASGTASLCSGYYGIAALYGELTRASGRFSAGGDAQSTTLTARRSITTAGGSGSGVTNTWCELFPNGDTGTFRMTLPSTNSVWTFKVQIAMEATTAGVDKASGYTFEGVIKKRTTTTSIVGSVTKVVLAEDDANWDARVTADDTNDSLLIEVYSDVEPARAVATVTLTQCMAP